MASTKEEIARDIVVAVISHRTGFVDGATAGKLYQDVLSAVKAAARGESGQSENGAA